MQRISKHRRLYIALTLLFALIAWTIWGNTTLTITRITISSSNLPPQFLGFRIAHISDLHNAEFGAENAKLLKKISETEPDIVTITGDLIDSSHTNIEAAVDFARKASQIAPVYYVTGNHEAWISQYDDLRDSLEAAGATVLENEAIHLSHNGSTITLLGLSDPDFSEGSGILGETAAMTASKLREMMEDSYTVLLSHRPELFETYVESGADLVLSGHAHGGQFRLPLIGGLIAPNQGLFPKYDAGLYSEQRTHMVVSCGLGNSIIPVRFNNRPEVVLVELKAGGTGQYFL